MIPPLLPIIIIIFSCFLRGSYLFIVPLPSWNSSVTFEKSEHPPKRCASFNTKIDTYPRYGTDPHGLSAPRGSCIRCSQLSSTARGPRSNDSPMAMSRGSCSKFVGRKYFVVKCLSSRASWPARLDRVLRPSKPPENQCFGERGEKEKIWTCNI